MTKLNLSAKLKKDKTLNYLDVEIKIANKKHTFGIFRKPTTTDIANT